jgi:hypothetical protein
MAGDDKKEEQCPVFSGGLRGEGFSNLSDEQKQKVLDLRTEGTKGFIEDLLRSKDLSEQNKSKGIQELVERLNKQYQAGGIPYKDSYTAQKMEMVDCNDPRVHPLDKPETTPPPAQQKRMVPRLKRPSATS